MHRSDESIAVEILASKILVLVTLMISTVGDLLFGHPVQI